MDRQVFQTDSRSRWTRFKWSLGILLTLIILLVAVFVTMFFIDRNPTLPFKEDYRNALGAEKPYMRKNKMAREYSAFRHFFQEKKMHANYATWSQARTAKMRRFGGNTNKYIASWNDRKAGIRAAFYVNWDPMSYVSLKEGIGSLNLVMPEWFYINQRNLGLEEHIDAKGYQLMKKTGIPVMPVITNAYNGEFRPRVVSALLSSQQKRQKLIAQMLQSCQRHHFIGVNIDFEELQVSSNEALTAFVKELSAAFHRHGLYVSQDIQPNNEDYDVRELAKYDDYLMLMAYDEHSAVSAPGPVSSQQWIGHSLDAVASQIPESKIILGIGAYGYDWTPKGDNNQSITIHDAMSLAADSDTPINFDPDTYSLYFSYRDEDDVSHQVYFNDAATNFNTLRYGCEYDVAGFGVWRLGSEDHRLWKFYGQDLAMPRVTHLHIGDLETIEGDKVANYVGSGEVLDVIGTPRDGSVHIDMDNADFLIDDETYTRTPTSYELEKHGSCGPKDLLLTFDDGPDARWTPQVLRILRQHHVHAAFFMVGLMMEKNLPLVRKVYEDGNLIGDHTFTHHNVAENSPQRTYMELRLTRMLVECITGRSTILFRAPYNADSDPSGSDEIVPLVEAKKQNFMDVGESIDPEDWQPGVKAETIFERVVKGVEHGNGHIILLHDAGGDTRKETVKALPRIIEYLQKKGYHFITLDSYLGRGKDELMPSVPKGKEYYAMQANLTLAEGLYAAGNFVTALFIIFLVLGIGRLLFMAVLVAKERRQEQSLEASMATLPEERPKVTIIVPAYNEEVDAVSSLENLLLQDYPNYDIVFVDDGSKDHTYEKVREAFANHDKIHIYTKPNGGKASALNFGIARTDADYVVCIDADTKLKANAVSMLMRHFLVDSDGRVGAVAGSVKVGNEVNMLTKWQAIEYTTSQNFDRMAYAAINAITVVPGAIGAFRRQAILDAGGLTTDTLAEDCDLTIRINKAGYRVENENGAVALTEAPERLGQFVKQRTRWCFGIMQTFWKNRAAMFRRRYHGLGLWALPNMLVFQFIIPTFSPLADVLMVAGLFSGNVGMVLLYYLLFLLVDASISIMAYLHEHERLWVLFWIIPQRLCYRWIMYVVLFKSYIKAIKGELQQWGVLKRTGSVGDVK
jgi:cellulose synthase/poly-beta-1,6-N-acetylglucosamine synthase-like glycosyltransferase/spore germination protein YaaH/peptidoglycan/xylan/chitin deacetylase (PgdA/CDA1 family)